MFINDNNKEKDLRLIPVSSNKQKPKQLPLPELDFIEELKPSDFPKKHAESSTGAKREKLNVLPYDLVPFQEITEAYSRVAEFGAQKYEPWNWSKGLPRVQLICSLLRHTFAYLRGEELDKESGLNHTDHILWNAVTLVHSVRWNIEDGRRIEPKRDYYDN